MTLNGHIAHYLCGSWASCSITSWYGFCVVILLAFIDLLSACLLSAAYSCLVRPLDHCITLYCMPALLPVKTVSLTLYCIALNWIVLYCVVLLLSAVQHFDFYRASICEGGLGSRNSVRLSHACIVTKLNDTLQIFLYHMKGQSLCYSDTKSGWSATPPSLWNLRSKWPTPFDKRRLRPISAHNVSAVGDSEKSSITTNIKSTTGFPTNHTSFAGQWYKHLMVGSNIHHTHHVTVDKCM